MEVSTLQVFLRVLYTVNSSPQYILAKSSSQVEAIICNEGVVQAAEYARARLNACLAAVCASSPELLPDQERDYSLYVLDPLEVQPLPSNLTSTSQHSGSPRGVAVALGLMSWALESNDSDGVLVTGTLTSTPTPALEVVFALRETKRVHKPTVQAFHSWGQAPSAPGPSQSAIPMQPQMTGSTSWTSRYPSSAQQEQRTITRSADFPELYIGPPRRSRGRPEGSTSSKSKSKAKSQTGDGSVPAGSSSTTIDARSESKQEGTVKRQRAKPRSSRPPTGSPFICAPLTRPAPTYPAGGIPSAMPSYYQQPYPCGQQPAQAYPQVYPQAHPYPQPNYIQLLGLLSAISSAPAGNPAANGTPEQQAALVSALQGVLATNPQLLHLAAAANTTSALGQPAAVKDTKHEKDADDGDSDIVILDSSTIDTSVFRKPPTRPLTVEDHDSHRDTSPAMTQQESPMPPSSQGTDASPMPASTPPSIHESTPASSHTSTPSVAPDSTPTPSSDVDPKTETSTSQRTPTGRIDGGSNSKSPSFSMPTTPTPSHTRKRKLGQYIQGQVSPSSPASPRNVPDSPSPTVVHTSSLARGLVSAMRERRVQSSPSRSRLLSSPSARLPSMLDAMRASTAARLQASSSGSSTQTLVSSTVNRKAKSSTESALDFSSRSGATASSSAAAGNGTAIKRRRTLNEVMAEQERERERSRKRSSSKRDPDARAPESVAQDIQLRPTKSAPIPKLAQSSPPRMLFRSEQAVSGSHYRPSTYKPGSVSYPVFFNPAASSSASASTSTSASVPAVSSTSTVASTKNPLKNFVLPAWARTSTATLPRLSDEALARQQAERDAKKAQKSLRRKEAAKAKRRRVSGAMAGAHGSKESSEDEEEPTRNAEPRAARPSSSNVRNALLLPPPLPPSLPVFASDAIEPIPSSPPTAQQTLPPPVVPSTPPRKRVSLGSGPQQTPGQPGSGSGSLFTPAGSLFTPSTPSITRSLSRHSFTPRSPLVPGRSATKRSPLKSLLQTPKTPKRDKGTHQTPRSVHTGRRTLFASPGSVVRTPQTQTSMGGRTFLLPPPSPCTTRNPQQKGGSRALGSSSSGSGDRESAKVRSPLDVRKAQQNVESVEDVLGRELDEDIHGLDGERTGNLTVEEVHDTTWNDDDVDREDYPSSPLPPSSPPPPTSPFSSPVKNDTTLGLPVMNVLSVPDSDVLLPSASDTEGPHEPSDTAWLSDDAATAAWFTDSEANAWLSETEAWLTDTEGGGGGPLLTDSDAAWLSDSDAVFGDMSSLPPSTASNWLSDDAGVHTDGDVGDGRSSGVDAFDVAAFEEAFKAFAQMEGEKRCGEKNGGEYVAVIGTKQEDPEFWEAIRPLLGGNDGGKAPEANRLSDPKDIVI